MQQLGIGIGLDYSSGVSAGGLGKVGTSGPAAPVLSMDASWDSSQASPLFDIDGCVAGDDLQFEYETSGAGWTSPNVTHHTVTSGEINGIQISLGIGALANGAWEARCKRELSGGSVYSAYSNVQAFTIAAAASNTPTYYFLGF